MHAAIETWRKTMQDMDSQVDALANIVGGHEGPLIDAVWTMQTEYTSAVAANVGDTDGNLSWWALEVKYGLHANRLTVKLPRGRARRVRTVADLVRLILADRKAS